MKIALNISTHCRTIDKGMPITDGRERIVGRVRIDLQVGEFPIAVTAAVAPLAQARH